MAVSNLILQLGEIPIDGVPLQGEIDRNVFDLTDKLARPLSPLRYDIQADLAEGFLLLRGRLSADFELTCALTTKLFPFEVLLDPYMESIEVENGQFLDLTEQLREDILLALPAYPRAPGAEADLPKKVSEPVPLEKQSGRAEWDALDGLKTSD
ncbi:MAG: hypothetical protein ACI8T1_003633 [Verrucomicrobiales bacterium]|jgi:uncharacterized protein